MLILTFAETSDNFCKSLQISQLRAVSLYNNVR